MSSTAFSPDWWTSDIEVAGAGIGLTNPVFRRMRVLALIITSASSPMAIFCRDLVPGKVSLCRGVLGSAGALKLLTAVVVAVWVASGDEWGRLEDVNIGRVYALPWIIRRGAARVRLCGAGPCDTDVVETRIVETRLFACCLSRVHDPRQVPHAVSSSGISLSSVSGSISDSVWSDLCEFWYSSLLSSLRQTVSICSGASVSTKCSVYAVVCNVLLLGRLVGRDGRRRVICGGEELQPNDWVPCEVPDSAASVRVLWELPDSVRAVPDPDPLSTSAALRLRMYILPTCGADWLSDLPWGCLDMV